MKKIIIFIIIVITLPFLYAATPDTTIPTKTNIISESNASQEKVKKQSQQQKTSNIKVAIDWLNGNTGFVMSILTAVYVLATILILKESRSTNRLQYDAIMQSAAFESGRNRPYVVFEIISERVTYSGYDSDLYYYAKVQNIGRTSAHNLSIKTSPEINAMQGFGPKNEKEYRIPSILKNELSFLAPGGHIKDYVGPARFLFEENSDDDLRYDISITYSDINNKSYEESYIIDLAAQKERCEIEDVEGKKRHRLFSAIENGASSLKDLVNVLDSPDRSNFFFPINSSCLSKSQTDLIVRLISCAKDEADCKFIAMKFIGGEKIEKISDVDSMEIEGSIEDVEYLCRAGVLHGHYQHGTLLFNLSPGAKTFINSKQRINHSSSDSI